MNRQGCRSASTKQPSFVTRSANRRSQKRLRREVGLERLEERTLLAAVAPPSGVISWWTADNTPADLMGPNNGSLFNGATFGAGKVSQAFNFDGIDDNLQAPTTGLPTGSACMSLSRPI